MKYFLYGMDQKNPAACARMLRERGIGAVVAGSFTPEAMGALLEEGIEAYLCFGAYGIAEGSAALAQDPFGQPRGWFGSGCPNDRENARQHLDSALEKAAALPGLRGVFVDGARFASFASKEGLESFFTCFCPRCMREMREQGMDAEAIRLAAGRLMRTRKVQPEDAPFIRQWLLFREHTVKRYMDQLTQRVHALPGHLLAGAFIFAPSLGKTVGQTAEACRSLDIVSHMLYRAYPHETGVACLGHEWAAFRQCFDSQVPAFLRAAGAETFPLPEQPPAELLEHGFPPEWIASEVARGRKDVQQQLWPILQIEDERIAETVSHAQLSGADATGFFAYGQADVPFL